MCAERRARVRLVVRADDRECNALCRKIAQHLRDPGKQRDLVHVLRLQPPHVGADHRQLPVWHLQRRDDLARGLAA
jgi:hypothetical protein